MKHTTISEQGGCQKVSEGNQKSFKNNLNN